MAKLDKKPKKLGRPRIPFKKKYCGMLLEHMRGGLSFESFGGLVPCGKGVLYDWATNKPLFSEAKRQGDALARLKWEQMLNGQVTGELKGSPAALIFGLKNKFPDEYRDTIDHTNKGGSFEAAAVNITKPLGAK